ncbi:alpha/beta hydrolase [Cryobacterium sp. MP_3.1]|uniref:alpha/beta hydrolase n=1 Tax=Cryobacterium sp. MP_3.1 TaxID=3071711 RepID=UPI002E15FE59
MDLNLTHPRATRNTARRPLIASIAAVAIAAAPLLALAPAAPSIAATGASVNLDLTGQWQFTLGDDLAWADPAFDDSAWSAVTVPEVGGGREFDDYDGYAWYRLSFDLPTDAAGTNLVASMGFMDDVDEVYLNGTRINGSGSLPPDAKSQWFEQRLYPVPADLPVFGGSNTLAVRLYDMTGGGGWYQGPVGLYSKDALRQEVLGISGPLADPASTGWVQDLLAAQAGALASGDIDAYLATLSDDYVHDGRDLARREDELRQWLAQSGSLTLTDASVEIVESSDGRLVVDTNRTISGMRDGQPYDFQPTTQEFLTLNRDTRTEQGNHSRFFRDYVESTVEDARREYITYLPPSYFTQPDREFPVIYLLHGFNGGSREWEPRDFGTKLDELYTTGGLAESIVIMPDAESLWYVDNDGGTPWRTMFTTEMIPQVDEQYRTLASREYRGLSGVSMGGFGAYSLGLAYPDLFSSMASHMGALNLAPAQVGVTSPGGPQGQSASPLTVVAGMSTEALSRYDYFFDACEFDDYAFDNAARSLDTLLTGKGVTHTYALYPEGRHNDACWVPRIADSFGMHSDHVRAAGLVENNGPDPVTEPEPTPGATAPAVIPPSPTATPSASPAAPSSATPTAATTKSRSGDLAATGVDPSGTIGAVLALVAAGAVLLVIGRRRSLKRY